MNLKGGEFLNIAPLIVFHFYTHDFYFENAYLISYYKSLPSLASYTWIYLDFNKSHSSTESITDNIISLIIHIMSH